VSLTRAAAARLREAIVSGRLAFGEPLSEAQLATAFGMSKAPVRAALIELREKGLVTIAPQAGTFVCSPTAEDIAKLSSFRCLIETDSMRRALSQHPDELFAALGEAVARMTKARERRRGADYIAADTAYHLAFITLSDNRYLAQAYDLISGIVEALRVRLFNASQSFREQSLADHIEILRALRKPDFAQALRIIEDHIMRTVRLVEIAPASPRKTARRATRTGEEYQELFRPDGGGGP
jgi:DNA-binding GntR family transcriptional regulator